jgi:hypothetical protein
VARDFLGCFSGCVLMAFALGGLRERFSAGISCLAMLLLTLKFLTHTVSFLGHYHILIGRQFLYQIRTPISVSTSLFLERTLHVSKMEKHTKI